MHNYRITFLLVGLMFLMGIFGLDKMAKAEFPDFTIRQGVVVAVYPGATAEEVEEQVARPLERYLFTFDEVKRKKTTSNSSNGMCTLMVELQDNVNNKDEVWSKIRHGLNTFKQQLPQGVLAIAVNDDFGETSAILMAIESEHRSYRELKKYSDDLADELRRIESVSNVNLYGEVQEQISLYIDRERLAAYGIGQLQLIQTLNASGLTTMSGSITGWQKDVPIHVKNAANNEEEIENTIIYTDPYNHVVRVKDVAEVKREYDVSESYVEYNGHPCVILSLEMVPGNNIVQYGKDVQQIMDEYIASRLPDDVTVQRITDQCKVVDNSVTDFLINLIESMVIIFIVMLVLFPWRTAVVAGTMVPLNTFISVAIMYFVGIPLNTVTLAALIIVMGMVVDNAIVVLDGYLEYLKKGTSRWHAAARSSMHYFTPMALATACICAIFFPMLAVMTGMSKDMLYWLPWTMAINLLVSLVLAVVYIPIMEVWLIKTDKTQDDKPQKKAITDYVQEGYEKVLDWTFRHPWLTICGGVATVVLSVILIGPQLMIRMMPTADRNQFAVEISLPQGKGLAETKAIADSVYRELRRDERVVSVTSFIGCSSPRFHAAYAPKSGGRNYAQFIVNTTSTKATVEVLDKFEPMSDRFPNAFVKFKQLDYQNYTPFEFRFYGENLDSLHRVAEDVMALMRQNPDVMNVKTDYEERRPFIEVELDPVASAQLGMNRTLAELELMLNTGEVKVGQVWEHDYQVPIILKDKNNEQLDYAGINNLYLSSGYSSIPLRQMADAQPAWGETHILHRNGVRCITVNVEARRGVYTNALQSGFTQLINDKISLPAGVRFEVGGEPENDAEQQAPIGDSLIIAFIIVFFFLLFNFKTYKLTFVSVAAIFLVMPGALIGLWWMNRPIGVTAVAGILTLMGMIMRNEILIFEHADDLRKLGWTARDAAYDAGRRRMVPIFLTTATTAMGVVPMIIAATNFWMPVGVTICAGGIGSLILVVIMLPVIYWKLFEKKKDKQLLSKTEA
ncbi:MAG: efflux RND transporter permease subunit [Bacteroidaceae bacterium]|nr:efflux RND transporter permease subunit [Bacteroidaceae bacterium]